MNGNQSDLDRLKTLYSISKKLSVFSKVDESFPEILECAAESFPLTSAVLIEHWEQTPNTVIWTAAEDIPDEAISKAVRNAKAEYSYFYGASPQETSDLENAATSTKKLNHNARALRINKTENGYYIAVPLIIDNLPPLGALQLEGNAALDENDLDFVIALANLVAVALDRYYKTKNEHNYQKKEIHNLEHQRDLRESFVNLLTHDLRSPMSVVLGAAQMILRKPENIEATKKSAEMIIMSVNRANGMVTDLLDANRIRGGELLQTHKEKTILNDLISATISELTITHGNRFILEIDGQIICLIDPQGIKRIIENLANNAIKYGSTDSPVTIKAMETTSEIHLFVHNEGSYIPPEEQISLFKEFRRTVEAHQGKIQGWGIGLTLVKGVTEAHKGKVSVSSDPEKGTVFTVSLPKNS